MNKKKNVLHYTIMFYFFVNEAKITLNYSITSHVLYSISNNKFQK